jgi:hypothetical protein
MGSTLRRPRRPDEPRHDGCACDGSDTENSKLTGGEGDDSSQTGQRREKEEDVADRKWKRGCGGRRRRIPAEHGVEFRVLDAKLLLEGCEDLLLVRGQGLLVWGEGHAGQLLGCTRRRRSVRAHIDDPVLGTVEAIGINTHLWVRWWGCLGTKEPATRGIARPEVAVARHCRA